IPGREARNHTERPAHADRVAARHIALQDFALGEVHPTCSLLDGCRDEVLLERGEGDRAARFLRENLGDLCATALYDRGGVEEELGALGGRASRPSRERLGGGLDSKRGFR